jgi:hypothetical protein
MLRELEVDAYFVECVQCVPEMIQEEFARVTADIAYWNERYTRGTEQYLRAKALREKTEGRLSYDKDMIETLSAELGKKPTVDQIKGRILNHAEYEEAKSEEIAAEAERIRCRGAVEAVATKRDMLVSLGATMREELKRDPMIRDK